MYVEKLFPYLKDGDFVRSERKVVDISSIYCPLESDIATVGIDIKRTNRDFKLIKILPCDLLVFDESDEVAFKVKNGLYGDTISAVISEIDYTSISNRLDVSTVDDVLSATMMMNGAYYKEEIITDEFINICSNGVSIPDDVLSSVKIKYENGISFSEWVNSSTNIKESADMLDSLVADKKSGKSINTQVLSDDRDSIYNWMDAYFALPEGEDMKSGGREVVPLLIGPTAVFKSATVKELCKKYNYRMVDFRVAFTSRLDYSGLYEMGEIEGDIKKYSYSCPMEEIVTCSDGFREFCRQSYDKISDILRKGYIEDNKVTDGENSDSNQTALTDEQRDKLSKLLAQYKEYMKTPVLFFDEITRCKDGGVNGILVQLLNQKRFQNMTLNGCKFVAATNLNISNDAEHARLKYELDDMYDVAEDIDVAYSNRFIPLKVFPQDVKGRWFEWAESTTEKNGKTVTSIHPVILEFLKGPGDNLVYNDTPVLTAIDNGLSKNEINSQTFPNYRTWDMLSGYLYSIDEDYEVRIKRDNNAVREYRINIVNGLISSWAGERFIDFLNKKGYKEYEEVHGVINDDVGDFLNSTLSSGTPALLIGPSSLGKTSRVNAYRKKVEKRTGLKPELISVNLASMDTADLMGYPIKRSLVEYSAGEDLEKYGLGSVKKELEDVIKGVASNLDYGMTDSLTVRAPSMEMKLRFQKALKEGREVILFFDEANRVKNPTIMSAMFECFTEDTPVRLLDGRTLTMSELYKEAESGNVDLWTYSVDNDGKVVPGHISCVIKKKPKTKMIRISMEDGSTVECTEDHKFMLMDGSYVMAKDLTDDMDIMEVDSRISDKDNGDTISGYEIVCTNSNKNEEYTHRIVACECKGWESGCGRVIHHSDFNKKNNLPDNLNCEMTYLEHISYHGNHLEEVKESTDFETKRRDGFYKMVNEKGESYQRWVSNLSKPKDKEVCKRISETKKKKCAESDEYRLSLSEGFIRYNAKVASGEIVRDYSYVREYHKNHPELAENFVNAGKKYWSDENHKAEQSERRKEYFKSQENHDWVVEHARDMARIVNKSSKCISLQQLGKIKRVVRACLDIYEDVQDITESMYEEGRKNSFKNAPKYETALNRMKSLGVSFSDIILEELGGKAV